MSKWNQKNVSRWNQIRVNVSEMKRIVCGGQICCAPLQKTKKNKDLSIDFHRIGSTDSIRSSFDGKIKITKEIPANPGRAAPDLGDNTISLCWQDL